MSTYVLMKILESAPGRYDRGIRILTLGGVDRAYDRLASRTADGQRVLDIGCGTGALTLRAAREGAVVKGIDVNSQMLEIARERADQAGLAEHVEFCEMGVADLGSEKAQDYDVVMSGLCFSELTRDEASFALKHAHRILKPGGILLIADETRPGNALKNVLTGLLRLPLVIVTYLLTQASTSAVKDLPERAKAAGFEIESVRFSALDTFIEVVARKSEGSANG